MLYESVRGVYDPVGATYRFFYGVYGVVCGVFRIVHGVFRIYLFNSEKVEKDETPENLIFRKFCFFRVLSESKKIGIPVNSATLASEKWHYCKAKQTILTSYIGTIPMLKWLRSDSTKSLFQKTSNLLTQQG